MTARSAPSRPTAEQLRLPLERHAVGEAFVVSDSNVEAV
ncbi:chromosomal replication initiator DnaA, partial [Salmonella sp. gx-f5]|nr:chromosomal replication initiator DnaA [Salmonella sp. gx-f5]